MYKAKHILNNERQNISLIAIGWGKFGEEKRREEKEKKKEERRKKEEEKEKESQGMKFLFGSMNTSMEIPLCLSSDRKILLEILLVGINVFMVKLVVA